MAWANFWAIFLNGKAWSKCLKNKNYLKLIRWKRIVVEGDVDKEY